MKKILPVLFACAALTACSPSTPSDEETTEANMPLASFPDPTAIKAAIDAGATRDSGGHLVVDGTPYFCKLTNGVWSLDPNSGDTMSRQVYGAWLTATIVTDPGMYLYSVNTFFGVNNRFDEVGSTATFIDPY